MKQRPTTQSVQKSEHKNATSKLIASKEARDQSNENPMIFSFFSGAGFLDLGFENAGFQIGYVNEIHAPFLDAYKHSRRRLRVSDPLFGYHSGDIEDCLTGSESDELTIYVQTAKESRLVGFIGGPPCPDFSIAGKNRGQYGENGKLSRTYIDLICKQRPDFFIFENVKGLYRTARHREFFEGLKQKLKAAGYECTERLINAIEYGAPQDRERIILFGVQQNSLQLNPRDFNWTAHAPYPDRTAFSFSWPQSQPIALVRKQPTSVPAELTINHWFERNEVVHHPNASHQFVPRAGLERFKTVDEGDDSKKSYKRLHRWRYSPTAAYGNNEVHIHPWLPRRISVAEALAIQSLPKEFELPPNMTLSNMFKTIGNGVPYLAAHGLARSVHDFLQGGSR
jgi:DNA (cytosine-5)-methyltransferase 1